MSGATIDFRHLTLATCLALGLASAAAADKVTPPAPVEPQPAAAALQPGLQMLYFSGDFKHVENMPKTPAELAKGTRGAPVPNLAASTDGGPMWGIASSYEYFGAHFTGLINLEPGEYSFLAKSNDGVRVHLDRMRVVDDPDIHVDRLSTPVKVAITKAGWYPITVQYFQRRGTARLEVMWQPPGANAPAIIPASVFAHVPG